MKGFELNDPCTEGKGIVLYVRIHVDDIEKIENIDYIELCYTENGKQQCFCVSPIRSIEYTALGRSKETTYPVIRMIADGFVEKKGRLYYTGENQVYTDKECQANILEVWYEAADGSIKELKKANSGYERVGI